MIPNRRHANSTCEKCGAAVLVATIGGRSIVVDPTPVRRGDLAVQLRRGKQLPIAQRVQLGDQVPSGWLPRMSHTFVCPNPDGVAAPARPQPAAPQAAPAAPAQPRYGRKVTTSRGVGRGRGR